MESPTFLELKRKKKFERKIFYKIVTQTKYLTLSDSMNGMATKTLFA